MAVHTRNAIKEAFAQLALERPIEKITVRDITAKSQVSRNTFYYYFHDVYDVLEEYLNDMVQSMIRRIEEERAAGKDLDAASRAGVEYQLAHKELFYCIYQSSRKREVSRCLDRAEKTMSEYFVELLSEGIPASEADKELIAAFCLNAMKGFIAQWMEGEMRRPLGEILGRMHILMGGGVIREALQRSVEFPEKSCS